MPDGHPAAHAILLGEVADEVDVHVVRGGADVQVQIHVCAVLPGQFEDAGDVPGVVRIVIGRPPNDGRTALEPFLHIGFGLGHVGHSLLRENAQFQVDRPAHVLAQLQEGLKAAHSDIGVHLHVGAHVGGPVEHAGLQGGAGAGVNVLHRKVGLDGGNPPHVVAAPVWRGCAAVQDARFVQVNVGLDEPW